MNTELQIVGGQLVSGHTNRNGVFVDVRPAKPYISPYMTYVEGRHYGISVSTQQSGEIRVTAECEAGRLVLNINGENFPVEVPTETEEEYIINQAARAAASSAQRREYLAAEAAFLAKIESPEFIREIADLFPRQFIRRAIAGRNEVGKMVLPDEVRMDFGRFCYGNTQIRTLYENVVAELARRYEVIRAERSRLHSLQEKL